MNPPSYYNNHYYQPQRQQLANKSQNLNSPYLPQQPVPSFLTSSPQAFLDHRLQLLKRDQKVPILSKGGRKQSRDTTMRQKEASKEVINILMSPCPEKVPSTEQNTDQFIPKLYFSVKKSNYGSLDFKKSFTKFGPLIHLYLCEKKQKGTFLYGFVWFRYPKDAQRVLKNSPLKENGVKITVRSVKEKDLSVFEFFQRVDQINRIELIQSSADFSMIPKMAFDNFRFWSYLEESIYSEETSNLRLLFMIDAGHRNQGNVRFNTQNVKGKFFKGNSMR